MKTDAQLIEQVRQGDLQAYGELVRRYEYAVRGAALAVLGDHHAAEDAAQEAFVTAYEKLGSLRHGSKFGQWVLKIARHRAARAVRKRRRPASLETLAEPADSSSDGQLCHDSEHLLHLVCRLPEHERVVIALRHFDGHSVEQIAHMTHRPVGTVTKQLSRAHGRLRHWLEEPRS